MSEKLKEHDAERVMRKYFMVFLDAWQDFLEDLKKGEFHVPSKEEGLRCLLFAKCLEIMRQKKFEKPYEIFVEDKEIVKGTRADIALGWLEDGRFVAVEVKDGPDAEKIKADIKKLQRYVKSGVLFGFFAMIGDSKYEYRTYLNLKELGIKQEIQEADEEATIDFKGEGEQSFYQWKKVKPKYYEGSLETLIVGLGFQQS
jgi:hypothetical protein